MLSALSRLQERRVEREGSAFISDLIDDPTGFSVLAEWGDQLRQLYG